MTMDSSKSWWGLHTQVLDVDHTRVPQTSVVDGRILRVGNHAAVTALGDAQAVS